ncbi:MAG TPA: ROK family transcriptional regulator [Gaiellales bacterium]|nr:ROK family transcriptional regulator [Gaiellales bacterium]
MNPLNTHSTPVRRADQRAVRKSNLSLVARRIAEARSLSRAQLAKQTGLNKTTVSSLVAELIERGVVAESGLAEGGGVGRPAQILELDDSRIAALGLEINVDYLAVCVCDLRGAVRYRASVGHDNRENLPELVFEALAELAGVALAECDVLGLTPIGAGVSLPGTVEAETGVLVHAPNLGWDEIPAAGRLRDALGDPPFPIRVANDANLAALGELESGALRGIRHGLLIYGNIGIGGAVIVDGAIFPGSDGFAGEIGHIPVRPFDGERCRCGGRGCLETLAGQEAIARRVGIQGTRSETASPAELVAERARGGDPDVIRALDEVAEFLGICIAGAVSLVNPRRVVLAGTLGTLAPWLLAGARVAVAERTRVAPTAVEIVGSELGDEAAIRGGAALVLHSVLNDPTCAPVRALA